ncbi:hypothetical protein BC941DRAFT_416890 [Chlamydoabsidia padenii]|nr:hypothetical protein BC941DRAFT_416890 [Chlamydoabsidia padenii]
MWHTTALAFPFLPLSLLTNQGYFFFSLLINVIYAASGLWLINKLSKSACQFQSPLIFKLMVSDPFQCVKKRFLFVQTKVSMIITLAL